MRPGKLENLPPGGIFVFAGLMVTSSKDSSARFQGAFFFVALGLDVEVL